MFLYTFCFENENSWPASKYEDNTGIASYAKYGKIKSYDKTMAIIVPHLKK